MRTVEYKLKSMPGSPLFFGKPVFESKNNDETHDQHAERTWKLKVATLNDQVIIQPFALKNAMESAAKRLQKKVPGMKNSTFTKLFTQGILVTDQLLLTSHNGKAVTIKDVEPIRLFVPADGRRGGPKRVERIFPSLQSWMASAQIHVLDNKITDDVLLQHLEEAGRFIGFGSMRVENGGINGRFEVFSA